MADYDYPNAIPQAYLTPIFPSLYWPFRAHPGEAKYLESVHDIWQFTTYWTLIFVCAAHFIAAVWAILMQFVSAFQRRAYLRDLDVAKKLSNKNRKLLGEHPVQITLTYVWIILAVGITVGAIEAFISGSLVGVILGSIYNAGYFKMSTWTPFIWGIINMLVMIVASFRIQGGL